MAWCGRACSNYKSDATIDCLVGMRSGGGMLWAVSQAAPLRRVHVTNNLDLFQYVPPAPAAGYSSGGFMANCKASRLCLELKIARDSISIHRHRSTASLRQARSSNGSRAAVPWRAAGRVEVGGRATGPWALPKDQLSLAPRWLVAMCVITANLVR